MIVTLSFSEDKMDLPPCFMLDDDDIHPILFLIWGPEMRCPIFPNRSITKYHPVAVLMAEQGVLMNISCFPSLFLK